MITTFSRTGLAASMLGALALAHSPAHAQEAATASAPTVVEIVMTNFAFTPQTLTLKAGTPYRLHFVNNSSKPHNYVSRTFFAALSMSAEDKAKIASDDQIELASGQSATLDVVPQQAGTYAVRCTHPMHSMMGMKGTAVIE